MCEAGEKQDGEPIDTNQTYACGFVGQNISRKTCDHVLAGQLLTKQGEGTT